MFRDILSSIEYLKCSLCVFVDGFFLLNSIAKFKKARNGKIVLIHRDSQTLEQVFTLRCIKTVICLETGF